MTERLVGLYTCTVSNNKPSSDSTSLKVEGKHNIKCHLMIFFILMCLTVASAPDNLSLKQDGETSIIVSWTKPTPLGDTRGYRVYYTNNITNERSIDTNSSTITLTQLVPLTEYEISVVGLSEHFSSDSITSFIFLG